MKHRLLIIVFLATVVSQMMQAGPVHERRVVLQQPDGTLFNACFSGDEFLRIKTTSDGCAIIQDSDGWWCYASYDADGTKVSSGVPVTDPVSGDVISDSRRIPYARLTELAVRARYVPDADDTPVLRRMIGGQYGKTKADDASDSLSVIKNGIVILAQFANLSFRYTRDDFDRLLNSTSYARDGATGSAREYFEAQFNDAVKFKFDVCDIVTLSHDLDYYGGNVAGNGTSESDKAPAEMVIEACNLADPDVDFSQYDDDGDGEVDNVFVFFAGGDEAEGAGDDCIWSHAWYIKDGAGKKLTLDGKVINRYACSSELSRFINSENEPDFRLAGIGTFCHEYSHTLGLQDMYDTDYEGSGGESKALWGSTSLMDGGNHNNEGNTPPFFNAIEREMMGLSMPQLIEQDGVYSLDPINVNGKYYRIDTDDPHEYFLLECRLENLWDKYIGGSGLLVYHVDRSGQTAGFSEMQGKDITAAERWKYNQVNCRPDRQCADLLEAMPDAMSVRNVFYPLEGVNAIPAESMQYWNGRCGKLSITDIRREGDGIVFSVIGANDATTPPDPVSLGYEKYQDAALVTFESDKPYMGEAVLSWGPSGKASETLNILPYEEGKYAVLLEGLEPRTSYTVSIAFTIEGVTGKQADLSFMTNTYSGGYPYIYLKNVQRNPDGTFLPGSKLPLRVYNAVGAASVVWTMNGKNISVGADGHYKLEKGGRLRAVVSWEDGSQDVIIKEIRIADDEEGN